MRVEEWGFRFRVDGLWFEGSLGKVTRARVVLPTSPQNEIKPPFLSPLFVLALAGIRPLVVHIKANAKGDLIRL